VAVGSTGSATFNTGTSITLSATNGRDVVWSGACSSGGNKVKTCSFTLQGNASVTAKESMLKDELRYLRTQIIVYRAQHHDVSPGYPGGDVGQPATDSDFTAQMTRHTDDKGAVSNSNSATYKFGPYLSEIPENPVNKLKAIQVVADGDPWPTADGIAYGWFYRPSTGDIMPNSQGVDGNGQLYTSY